MAQVMYIESLKKDMTGINLKLSFPTKKISCKDEEIVNDFKNLWPIINRVWPQYKCLADNNVKFFYHLIPNHSITYPNVT